MKTSLHILFAALAAIATTAACVQEITPPSFEKDKVNPAAEGSRVIAVSFAAQPQTKTALDGFQPKFEDGKDTVLISNTNALDTCVVSVKDNKATISTNLTGPLTAVYPYKAAGLNGNNSTQIDTVLVSTEQSGKFADANICMAKMKDGKDESLSFENKTALFCITPGAGADTKYVEVSAKDFNIANNVLTGSEFKNYDKIHVATTSADSVWVSILVPEGLKVSDLTFSDGTNEKAITTGATADKEIAAGTLYTVTNENWKSPEADTPDGAIKSVFTVSAGPDGKAGTADDIKVHFSQGNLQATYNPSTSTYTWGFAANQYDYIGDAAGNTTIDSQTNGAVVDLFGWSTAITNYGIDTSEDNSNYSGNFVDWGKAYCESKSITPDNTWRTLTKDEWTYLFNTRTVNGGVKEGKSYQRATINSDATGLYGMILYPDNYTGTAQTSYTSDEWVSLENEGCVFLPVAGSRIGSSGDLVGELGFYWSSTASGGSDAYGVYLDGGLVDPGYVGSRYGGFSVRLVTNISAAPTPAEPTSEYVEIAADYDNDPNTANTTLKWYRQNLAITDSGNKSWKGGNESAVKVPGTDEDVIVGDYFQWGAYSGYCGEATAADKGLLIYDSFINTKCVDVTGSDGFSFKSAGDGKTYQFDTPSPEDDDNSVGISPYFDGSKGEDGEYTKYTGTDDAVLDSSDDVAHIILGDNWRMPTSAEFDAMKEATYWVWDSGDMGYYVYAPASGDEGGLNGKKSDGETDISGTYTKSAALLFFPAAGYGNGTDLDKAGSRGNYWSSSLDMEGNKNANCLNFKGTKVEPEAYPRSRATSVRPVSDL